MKSQNLILVLAMVAFAGVLISGGLQEDKAKRSFEEWKEMKPRFEAKVMADIKLQNAIEEIDKELKKAVDEKGCYSIDAKKGATKCEEGFIEKGLMSRNSEGINMLVCCPYP